MKSLAIIIGRAPPKYSKNYTDPNLTTWHVDLEINSFIPSVTKVARQQAYIAFNFTTENFEIKNLSETQEIYINGKGYSSNDDTVALESSDMIQIGTEDFIFLLPIDSKKKKKVVKEVIIKEEESKNQIDPDIPMQDESIPV
jgi:hypothetical protein